MSTELTAEKVMEMGKAWGEAYLSLLDPKECLAGLGTKECLEGLGAKEIVSSVDHGELLAELSFDEIEAYVHQHKKMERKPVRS